MSTSQGQARKAGRQAGRPPQRATPLASPEELRVAGLQLAPQLAAAGVVAHLVPHIKPLLHPQGLALGKPAAPAVPAAESGGGVAGGGGGRQPMAAMLALPAILCTWRPLRSPPVCAAPPSSAPSRTGLPWAGAGRRSASAAGHRHGIMEPCQNWLALCPRAARQRNPPPTWQNMSESGFCAFPAHLPAYISGQFPPCHRRSLPASLPGLTSRTL